MLDRLRWIYFIDPEDQDYKENSLNKKEEKIGKNYGSRHAVQKESSDQQHESGCGGNCIPKGSKDHVWLYSGISWFHETKWNFLCLQNTKITWQTKVLLRWPITLWFTNLCPCLKRWKSGVRKQQWTRNERRLIQSQCGKWRKSRAKKEIILEAQRDKNKVHFATLMDMCHLEKHGLRTKVTDTKAESCSVVTLRKMTLEPAQFWLNRARLRPKWLPPKYWMLLQDYQVVTDKQLVQDLPTLNWYVFQDKNWRSRGTSWTTLKWTPIGKIAVGKTIRGSSIGTLMGKSTKFGRSVCSSKTRIIPIGKCGWYQNGWREAEDGSDVEDIDEKRGSWWTHIISRPCVFGMYSTWMQTEWNYYWGVQKKKSLNHVFLLERWVTRVGKKPHAKTVAWSHDMRGKTCSKMRWEILRTDRQKCGAAA